MTNHILKYTLKDDISKLQEAGDLLLENNPTARDYLSGKLEIVPPPSAADKGNKPTRKLTATEQKIFEEGKAVFNRDAHCATCHQANGQGLANIYPPLTDRDWIGDDERLIKIALKGIWGPIKVNGQQFDPSKGVPPMPGFGSLLNDRELASVLSYVRQSFGNNGELVAPETVAKVREATEDRVNFYMADELVKTDP